MTRRELREATFKIIFGLGFNEPEEMAEQVDFALSEEDCKEEDKDYIKNRILDIVEKQEEIDKTIEETSEGWKLARIGKAELAILRLAVYEIKFDDDIPVKVAINEAVELAKAYCDVEAKGFVNALLAKLAK